MLSSFSPINLSFLLSLPPTSIPCFAASTVPRDMEEPFLFFEYSDELLERIASQALLHAAVTSLSQEQRFTATVDAEIYASESAVETSAHEKKSEAIVLAIMPVQEKLLVVNRALRDLVQTKELMNPCEALPYLRVRHALCLEASRFNKRPSERIATCDLAACYLLLGQGEKAKAIWNDCVAPDVPDKSSFAAEKSLIEAGIALTVPSRKNRTVDAGPLPAANAPYSHWIPYATAMLRECSKLDTFLSAVSDWHVVLRVALLVALMGSQKLVVLRESEHKLERQLARLAKTTRTAGTVEELKDTVETASSTSLRLAQVRQELARLSSAVQIMTHRALSLHFQQPQQLSCHAAFTLAMFSLIWNHLEPAALAIDSGCPMDLASALADVLLHGDFPSHSTRRTLSWALLQVCERNDSSALASCVALTVHAVQLPVAFPARSNSETLLSVHHELERSLLADPEWPTSLCR